MATNESITNNLKKKDQPNTDDPKFGGTVKTILESTNIKERFDEILKDRAPQYVSSIITLVNNDNLLKKADPYSVITSAMIAATLNLPLEKNLGYAYIIPYKGVASFQLGYKGLIQLALRTAQYKAINVTEVYEGELKTFDRLKENLEIDQGGKLSDMVIGYAGYFKLLNGFEKHVYWTAGEMETHKQKFSKSGNVWKDNYHAMAKKTVIRNMLSKWGILSVEMQEGLTREVTDPKDYPEREQIDSVEIIDL